MESEIASTLKDHIKHLYFKQIYIKLEFHRAKTVRFINKCANYNAMSLVVPNQKIDEEGWINVKFKKYQEYFEDAK